MCQQLLNWYSGRHYAALIERHTGDTHLWLSVVVVEHKRLSVKINDILAILVAYVIYLYRVAIL